MVKSNVMSKGKLIRSLLIEGLLRTFSDWQVSMSRDADPEFSFSLAPARQLEGGGIENELRVCDVFELRDEFFVVRTPEQALAFLQAFGPFQLKEQFGNVAAPIRFSKLMEWRDRYQDALVRSTENIHRRYSGDQQIAEFITNLYLWQPQNIEVPFGQPPRGRIACKDIEDSLRAAVFLDRLLGDIQWQNCAREDCRIPFRLAGKRTLYCSTDCAHLQAARDYNDRKQKAKLKKKQTAKLPKRKKA
jgi:hypothetical protein